MCHCKVNRDIINEIKNLFHVHGPGPGIVHVGLLKCPAVTSQNGFYKNGPVAHITVVIPKWSLIYLSCECSL